MDSKKLRKVFINISLADWKINISLLVTWYMKTDNFSRVLLF